ncbi:hypothetical protein ACH5RR_010375 [Cinchona calisaya]|uniref:Stomagen C-terminal domain-containing protein n=1 Tax=Cinchona calisaya TaxID=153742 RepID=A0ABD3AIR9_9GENT
MVLIQPQPSTLPISISFFLSSSLFSDIISKAQMARTKYPFLQLLFFILFIAAPVVQLQGSRTPIVEHFNDWKGNRKSSSEQELQFQKNLGTIINKNSKRLMIGSVAPTCTYNECRGCKYKCRAEQVPVEGNDPIHSQKLNPNKNSP